MAAPSDTNRVTDAAHARLRATGVLSQNTPVLSSTSSASFQPAGTACSQVRCSLYRLPMAQVTVAVRAAMRAATSAR